MPDATVDQPKGPSAPNPNEKPIPEAATPKPGPQMPTIDAKLYPVGIVSEAGSEIEGAEREVPQGEPPPLPVNSQLRVIGKATQRLDGRFKVTGAAKYTADVHPPGMLFGKMLTSPYPHARVKSIDTSAAEKAPGVKAVHVLDTVQGVATEKKKEGEAPDKYPMVRFAGQPIAGVAATSQQEADEATRLIKIEFEELPFVVDEYKAREKDAPLVFTGPAEQSGSAGGGGGPAGLPQVGNVRGPATGGNKKPNEIADAFTKAAAAVEAEFKTQVQTHCALEPHGVVVDYKRDGIRCWASTQGTGSVRKDLADLFGFKQSQVQVITEYMGGGFGAKFGAGNPGVLAAYLSKKAGAPVRMMCDRKEEHLGTGNRPSSNQKYKIAADKDGNLLALHLVNFGTGGVGTGAGASGPAQNLYTCPAICTEDYDVFTHAGPAAAFRAPGHPQAIFGLEQAMDELAEKLGVDPLQFREKIDPSDARKTERQIGAEKIGWTNRKPAGSDTGSVKRGIGFAQAIWYRFSSRDSHCEVRVTKDGSVELMSSVQDIGGGIRTALAQIVAEELGLKPTDITIKIGDTQYPNGPASGGSVTTNSITPAARKAAWEVKNKIAAAIAPKVGAANADDVVFADGKVSGKPDPSKSMSFRKACSQMGTETVSSTVQRAEDYPVDTPPGQPQQQGGQRRPRGPRGKGSGGLGGVQFAQVAVDTETGVIKVEKIVAVHDCGRPINPLGLVSQINGGVIQGMSYALYENRILDRNTGLMVNPNLEQYKIAGSKEMPQIDVHVIEQYWGKSNTDAAGIGEPAIVPTAGAIANAVYNAIGVRIRQIPMTPAVVLAAIAEKNGNEKKGA
jgi:CO/xanthine dehydrogenase Mo-binding subunit